jgi:hypothetical protein
MTQKQYEEMNEHKQAIKENLQSTDITPEEAIDALVVHLHFGKTKAIELVDEWGKGIFEPYSVWSKIKVSY